MLNGGKGNLFKSYPAEAAQFAMSPVSVEMRVPEVAVVAVV